MAAIANLTVKKADGVTDIVYDGIVGAGGDNSPAMWRQDTGAAVGLPTGLRASLKLGTRWNKQKSARLAEFEYSYPYALQDSTTTRYSSTDKVMVKGVVTVPQAIPAATQNEGVYQCMHALGVALMKSAMASGYAPT